MGKTPNAMHPLRRRHHGFHLFGRTDGFDIHPRSILLEVPKKSTNERDTAGLLKRSPPGSGDGGSSGHSASSNTATIPASSSSSGSCTPGDKSAKCEKPTSSSSTTLPIALGVAYVSFAFLTHSSSLLILPEVSLL